MINYYVICHTTQEAQRLFEAAPECFPGQIKSTNKKDLRVLLGNNSYLQFVPETRLYVWIKGHPETRWKNIPLDEIYGRLNENRRLSCGKTN